MAKNRIAYYTQTGRSTHTVAPITAAITDAFTAGTEGSKILRMSITSISGAPTDFKVYIGSQIIYIDATPTVGDDILTLGNFPLGANTQPYFNIAAGDIIKVQTSAGDTVGVAIYGEDY